VGTNQWKDIKYSISTGIHLNFPLLNLIFTISQVLYMNYIPFIYDMDIWTVHGAVYALYEKTFTDVD
jgi:hypothetical protein